MEVNTEDPVVLYVDDEHANRVAFRYLFEDALPTLRLAESGTEALTLAGERRVGVLLTDQRMPKMSGVALCEAFRKLYPGCIRMITTAYADMGTAIEAINRGAVHRYFSKPYQPEVLLEAIRLGLATFRAREDARELETRLLMQVPRGVEAHLRREIGHEVANITQILRAIVEEVIELRKDDLRLADPAVARPIEDLESVTRQLDAFVEALRGESRLSHCSPERVLVGTCHLFERHLPGATLALEITGPLPVVALSEGELGQVLVNLTLNAAAAIRDSGVGGRITITAEGSPEGMAIRVEDDGPGFPEEIRRRALDHGVSLRRGGTGGGLPLAVRLISQAGGTLELSDAMSGIGAAVVIWLPARPSEENRER